MCGSESSCSCTTTDTAIAPPAAGGQATYMVTGMTCGGCANRVTQQVSAVTGATVDVPTGRVTVTSHAPTAETAVRAAVEQAGYRLA